MYTCKMYIFSIQTGNEGSVLVTYIYIYIYIYIFSIQQGNEGSILVRGKYLRLNQEMEEVKLLLRRIYLAFQHVMKDMYL